MKKDFEYGITNRKSTLVLEISKEEVRYTYKLLNTRKK